MEGRTGYRVGFTGTIEERNGFLTLFVNASG